MDSVEIYFPSAMKVRTVTPRQTIKEDPIKSRNDAFYRDLPQGFSGRFRPPSNREASSSGHVFRSGKYEFSPSAA